MADHNLAVERNRDIERPSEGAEQRFDNLLADEVVAEWVCKLEREQSPRRVAAE